MLVIGNSAVNLLDYFVPCADAFDDFGEFDAEYNIQIIVIDLDKDGSEEILVSIGNGLTSLETAVFTIGSDDVFFRDSISGQTHIEIDTNGVVTVPYGSQGLFDEYVYENGSFRTK